MSRKLAVFLPLLVVGLALDLISKFLVLHYLPLGDQIVAIPGYFNLVHVHNKGVAFGLLSSWSVETARWFFILTTVVVLAVLGYLWWQLPEDRWQAALGYGLIMVGPLGILLDRVRLGEVVDFLDVHWGRYHWPAFNVADSLVCLGAGVLVWVILTEEKRADASNTV
jgi:signal peptidase II